MNKSIKFGAIALFALLVSVSAQADVLCAKKNISVNSNGKVSFAKNLKVASSCDGNWIQVIDTAEFKGADGKDGANGINGADGKKGADGTNGRDGKDGRDGTDGTNGTDGKDGIINFASCVTTQITESQDKKGFSCGDGKALYGYTGEATDIKYFALNSSDDYVGAAKEAKIEVTECDGEGQIPCEKFTSCYDSTSVSEALNSEAWKEGQTDYFEIEADNDPCQFEKANRFGLEKCSDGVPTIIGSCVYQDALNSKNVVHFCKYDSDKEDDASYPFIEVYYGEAEPNKEFTFNKVIFDNIAKCDLIVASSKDAETSLYIGGDKLGQFKVTAANAGALKAACVKAVSDTSYKECKEKKVYAQSLIDGQETYPNAIEKGKGKDKKVTCCNM